MSPDAPRQTYFDDQGLSLCYWNILYNSINEVTRRALEAKMKDYVYTSPFMVKSIAMGVSRSLLTVLRVRGIDVPDAARQRILDERDVTRIEQWLERAATAKSLAEVLDEPS